MPRGIAASPGFRREDDVKTYDSWRAARKRCNSPYHHCYNLYGGVGVVMCPEWDSFEQFVKDMGRRPKEPNGRYMTLDRIDATGNYEPSNCRWADAKTQRANQRPRTKA